MSDALTVGLSTRARAAIYCQTATQNHQGTLFQAGQITGGVLGAAIAFGNPCTLSTAGVAGYRLLNGIQVNGGVINASENIVNGHPWMAVLDAVGVLGNLATFLKACFEAGTPIRQRYGSKPIEQLQVGDWVLARSEFDPEGPIEEKQVEEVFVAEAQIWEVHVGGRVIRTTSEHPFWVRGKGWLAAKDLKEGNELCGEDGQRFVVAEVRATEEMNSVYNVRVADYHTYFVGGAEWGFAVWAHNTCQVTINRANGNAFRDEIADILTKAGYGVETEVYKWTPLGKRFIDIEVSQAGTVLGGLETKLGSSRYKTIQRLKDAYLRAAKGYIITVVRS